MSEMQLPEQLRPLLHEKIEALDAEHLALLHRVLLQMEVEELADKLGAAFDADAEDLRWSRLPEIIRECRARRRAA
jgi:hypothetical protein